jgi:hypothetical protein
VYVFLFGFLLMPSLIVVRIIYSVGVREFIKRVAVMPSLLNDVAAICGISAIYGVAALGVAAMSRSNISDTSHESPSTAKKLED